MLGLSFEEAGALLLLLCSSRLRTPVGTLPCDDSSLARLAGMDQSTWQRVRPAVCARFEARDGVLVCPVIQEEVRAEERYHATRVRAGKMRGKLQVTSRSASGDLKVTSRSSQGDLAAIGESEGKSVAADSKKSPQTPKESVLFPLNEEPVVDEKTNLRQHKNVFESRILELYALYPKKVDRGHALKAIRKALTKATFEQLSEAVKLFARACATKDMQFVPGPAPWFNGERWLDQHIPQAPHSAPLPFGELPPPKKRLSDLTPEQQEEMLGDAPDEAEGSPNGSGPIPT